MYLGSQRRLMRQLPNMYGLHPAPAIGQSIIFNKVPGLLICNYAHAGATPSPWPADTAFAVPLGRHNGVLQV